MTARPTWREDAACRHADPDLFFPAGAAGPARRQASEAKRICRACPARTPCLAWALDHGVTDGVWGATTPAERRAIRALPRTTTPRQDDDDGGGDQPAGHAAQDIRAPAARRPATRMSRGAPAGDGPGRTGAQVTADPPRPQRRAGPATSNGRPPGTAAGAAQAAAGPLHLTRPAGAHQDRPASHPGRGFARDFATTDGQRVKVAALTRRQFADLATTTRLARTFAFLERVLDADFCARGDLYTHRAAIGALLAPWFARHTVAELAAVFAGTSVQWAHLHIPAGSVLPHGRPA
jgi:WhiB family transcriptional regulator, redox-sensing transcriptional regulator